MSSRLRDHVSALVHRIRLGLSGGGSFQFRVKRAEMLTAEERRLLDRKGALLEAFATGSLAPWGRRQESFVNTVRTGGKAEDEEERVWLKYQARLAFESNPENEHIHDEPVGAPDPDRSYFGEKVRKGGKFFGPRRKR